MQQYCTLSDHSNYQAILFLLFVFGVIYNAAVSYLERRGWERGITALLVAFGSSVTLAPVIYLANFQSFADIIGLFVASGTPMIIGSLYRYLKEREAENEAIKKAAQGLDD